MATNKETEEINKASKLVVETMDEIFKSSTVKCSMYLLKYINDRDEEAFENFYVMYKTLTQEERLQVWCNVRANLIEQERVQTEDKKDTIMYI